MILGFGCITMATITTRILGNERERRIATALMAFAIPCSAQLGVIIALLAAAGGGVITLAYGAIMLLVFGLIGVAMARYLPGTLHRPAHRPAATPAAASQERPHQDLPQDSHVHPRGQRLLRRRRPAAQHPPGDGRPGARPEPARSPDGVLAPAAGRGFHGVHHGVRASGFRRRRPLRPRPGQHRRSWWPW